MSTGSDRPAAGTPLAAAGPVPEPVPTPSPSSPSLPSSPQSPSPSRALEVCAAVVAGLLCLSLLVGARGIEFRVQTPGVDPRWWPGLLGAAGLVLSVALLATALASGPPSRDALQTANRTGLLRLLVLAVLTVAYCLLWPLVTFVPATAGFLVAVTALLGGRRWPSLLAFPVLTALFLYGVFAVLLEVPL